MNPDLEDAIEAIVEMMLLGDKGPTEEEYSEWCNKWLPLVQEYGRLNYVVEF